MNSLPAPVHIAINRLQHVGLPVTNLEYSQRFYSGLGFAAVMTATFETPAGTGHVCMMRCDAIVLELYQMPEAELQAVRDRGNGHIDHVAFDVDDIDATFNTLKNAGYAIFEDAPVLLEFWKNGCRYFNIAGPDGERLEFNQIL